MFDLLKELESTDTNSSSSRVNAQNYLDKLGESIAIMKDLYNKDISDNKVMLFTSTDIIATSMPYDINGKQVSFKMAFSHGAAAPYAVEILVEVE